MSRAVSAPAKRAAYAQTTDEVFLVLLSIAHDDLVDQIRVVNNFEEIESGGDTYTPAPFEISLPGDSDENTPTAQVQIDNVDQSIIFAIRQLATPPVITVKVVLASSPNVVEAGPFQMTIREVDYDTMTITATLAYEDVLSEPYPGDSFTPANFPGLF